ncbi:lysophospholipid acyltransferase family protein [Marinicella rhabdoformis]|uniref:lysophospholipid acyltransferase family protein n=1 Tax=Marinicella rhabdoformis TaxID=2580566 RepID=UPI0012AEB203|nr:lysophospholipid acyltransferase family protein [Marinicella rhabdoformis]
MRKFLSNLYQIYVWLFLYPVAWTWTALVCIVIALMSHVGGAKWAGRYVARLWGKVILWITPVKVRTKGLELIEAHQSYVVVANHQSTYDILAVYGHMPLDFKWVIKQELRKVPFLGFACYKIGHIFVDRRNRQASLASMEAAKATLVDGTSVFFFPEGTRSSGQALNPFKKGAFKMAKDLGLPILPLSIADADKVMPAQSVRILPGTITLTFHEPVSLADVEAKRTSELADLTQQKIASAV